MRLAKAQYRQLAMLRVVLRRFLHFSENAAGLEGLTPQHYQAMLAIKGSVNESLSVGELAEQLCLHHHSTVGLVDRLVQQKMTRRLPSQTDRRRVEVRLTAAGEKIIGRLAKTHWVELQHLGPELRTALEDILMAEAPCSKI